MALARWQANIVNALGNILPGAYVEVRRHSVAMPLAVIKSDRDGAVAKANPFQADENGYAFFHAEGGAYRIRVYDGSFEQIFPYVAVGLGAESDLSFSNPRGEWDIAEVYTVGDYVQHGGFLFISRTDENEGNEPDDAGPGDTAEWMYAGSAIQGEKGDPGEAFFPDEVGTFAGRTAFDAEVEPFAYLSTNGDGAGNTNPMVYFKTGPGSGDWSTGVPFNGGRIEHTLYGIKGADIVSASTTNLAAATGDFVDVTASNTINALGTADAGTIRTVRFTGSPLITHNATSLILPGAANIQAAPNDRAIFRSLGSGNWLCVVYQRAAKVLGRQAIWVPASGMVPETALAPTLVDVVMTTNRQMIRGLNFPTGAETKAQFPIAMPKSWDPATNLFMLAVWRHPATTTNFGVAWGFELLARSNDDPLDAAWGTEVAVTDTGGTTDDIYVTSEATVTPGGSPAAEDILWGRITRVVGNAADNMAVDATLVGVRIYYITRAETDD